jgi:hypothetical protein
MQLRRALRWRAIAVSILAYFAGLPEKPSWCRLEERPPLGTRYSGDRAAIPP